ncbi:hypothetical protein KKC1_32180, partial [Calderihabitans maritimus]
QQVKARRRVQLQFQGGIAVHQCRISKVQHLLQAVRNPDVVDGYFKAVLQQYPEESIGTGRPVGETNSSAPQISDWNLAQEHQIGGRSFSPQGEIR